MGNLCQRVMNITGESYVYLKAPPWRLSAPLPFLPIYCGWYFICAKNENVIPFYLRSKAQEIIVTFLIIKSDEKIQYFYALRPLPELFCNTDTLSHTFKHTCNLLIYSRQSQSLGTNPPFFQSNFSNTSNIITARSVLVRSSLRLFCQKYFLYF